MTLQPGWVRRNSRRCHSLSSTWHIWYRSLSCAGSFPRAAAEVGGAPAAAAAAAAAAAVASRTVTRTGLRSPARASSSVSSVWVAEKSPVRRCLGSREIMALRVFMNPMLSSRSASSSTRSSIFLQSSALLRTIRSSKRPGVPMSARAPRSANVRTSAATSVPPTRSMGGAPLTVARKGTATSKICRASSRVGDTITAPTWCIRNEVSDRARISIMGSTKARVLPEPVHASHATSLFPAKRPIAAACTGVARSNPCAASTASDAARSGGVSAPKRGPSAVRCLGASTGCLGGSTDCLGGSTDCLGGSADFLGWSFTVSCRDSSAGGAVAALLPFVFIPPLCALAGPPRLVARGRLLSVYRVLSLDLRYRAQSLWWSLVDVRG
mmetsp:Transcript_10346/g.25429  ORF Transcript_10346/g.25429 Transcript_10346/m.25429 type:complete len:382 (-) Transcript_10346:18-1163(-)